MYLSAILMASIMALILFKLLSSTETDRWIQSVRDGVNGYDYGGVAAQLKKIGMEEKISPPTYRLLQCLLALFSFAILLAKGRPLVLCIGVSIIFVILPKYLIKAKIKEENKKMLSDIEHLFNLLYLQRQAGAFFLDSLVDAYRIVSYWRLKKALIDMIGAINGNRSIQEVTEEFSGKFSNPYLSILADIIRHGIEDGNNAEMLANISDQIRGVQQSQYIQEKRNQTLKSILFLTALLIGVLGMLGILFLGFLGNSVNALFY